LQRVTKDYEGFLARRAQRMERLREALAPLLQERRELVLEIGCGHGHYLAAFAAAHPWYYCIGFDRAGARVRRAEVKADRGKLDNALFLRADAGELLHALPEGLRFAKVLILFSDPWPKKRHHKNRIIQPGVLARLAAITAPGGELCFRTDHEGYFEWTMEQVAASPYWEIAEDVAWPFENRTVFQDLAPAYQSLVAVRNVEPVGELPDLLGKRNPVEEDELGDEDNGERG